MSQGWDASRSPARLTMSHIQVRGLTKNLGGRDILQGISLDAAPGDIVSLIGPSGCGKTTLLRCLLGELEPDDGQILHDGQDVTHVPVEKRRISIVYQDYALFPHMTVAENVGYGLRVRRWDDARIAKRVEELLTLVHLTEAKDQFPRSLSGGQQQRVALARALAIEPRVLLLDEAFTALDSVTRSELMVQVRDQEEAFLFARHVVVLNEGRVVVAGRPDHVMQHKNPFLQDFVKMIMLHRTPVLRDADGHAFVQVAGGVRIPLAIPGLQVGDEVHVMVKKGPERERVEVWPIGKP